MIIERLFGVVRWVITVLFISTVFANIAVAESKLQFEHNKIKGLIVYYSWSDNTRRMANVIQAQTGFDMEELATVTPYIREYEALLDQVRGEEQRGYLPPLKPLKADLSSYDVIFVGSPLWIYTLSSPVMSFLKSNDLSGKIIVPFSTRGTSSPDRLYAKVAELCPDSQVMKGFDITRGGFYAAQPALTQWLDNTLTEIEKDHR